jgi:hypothetical protein
MKYFQKAQDEALTSEKWAERKAEAKRRAAFLGEEKKDWTHASFDEFAQQLTGAPNVNCVDFDGGGEERREFLLALFSRAGVHASIYAADRAQSHVSFETPNIYVDGDLEVVDKGYEVVGHYPTWTIRPDFSATREQKPYYESFKR